MLVPKPSEWKLEPLDEYGVFIPGKPNRRELIINNGPNEIVRTQGRHTNWRQVKMQMMGQALPTPTNDNPLGES